MNSNPLPRNVLEKMVEKLEAENFRLRAALSNLRHGGTGGCFCEVAIGNPMMGGKHSLACVCATEALSCRHTGLLVPDRAHGTSYCRDCGALVEPGR